MTTATISPDMLKATYRRNIAVLQNNLKDLSHEESLFQPTPKGNCLNWVVGHILATRNSIFAILEQAPVWDEMTARRYARGSAPITTLEEAQAFGDMVTRLSDSQEKLATVLDKLRVYPETPRISSRTQNL